MSFEALSFPSWGVFGGWGWKHSRKPRFGAYSVHTWVQPGPGFWSGVDEDLVFFLDLLLGVKKAQVGPGARVSSSVAEWHLQEPHSRLLPT